MSEFGWAYISGSAPIQSAGGASGSVQFKVPGGNITGSQNFVYKNSSDVLVLSGTLDVSGSINVVGGLTASNFVIQNVTEIDSAGSSKFGNSSDDIHQYTGSIYVLGPVSSSSHISASAFIGDGSQLVNLPAAAIVNYNSASAGRVILSVNSDSVEGAENLSFKNNWLEVTGSLRVSNTVAASFLSGSGANVFNIKASNISSDTLDNARLPAAISVTSLTGALSASNLVGTIDNARLPTAISVTNLTGALSASNLVGTIDNARLPANISVTSLTASAHLSSSVIHANTANLGGFTVTGDSVITGSLTVSGSVYANEVITNVVSKNVTTISATGSTIFGDTSDDIHRFTGSVNITGALSASSAISASAFYGDGSTLSNLSFQAVSNPGQYRILYNGATSEDVVGQSDLSFKNNTLEVTGSLIASNTVSAVYLSGSGQNVFNIKASNISSDTLDNARLPAAISVTSLTGALSASNLVGTIDNARLPANISVTQITGSGLKLTGLVAGTATTSSFLALDSSNNIILTSSVGGGGGTAGAIGAAEDSSYADGLFTDFNDLNTTVGTAVDRFNEVLKILAPSPSPGVQTIGVSSGNGATAKLSFDDSNPVTGVTSSGDIVFTPAINRNQVYEPDTDGHKRKLGVFNNQSVTGEVNYDVVASINNGHYAYREDTFGNAETGSLKLELNGQVVHTVNLASAAGAGSPPNGTDDTNVTAGGSGFVNLSVTSSTIDGNGADWGSIFKYRSADYVIAAADQKRGWNYLRVIHTVGSTDYASNYIEWINDSGSQENYPLYLSNPRIENINLVGSRHVSGVEYNTDATADYKVDLHNMYRDVFPSSGTPISFSATNSTTPGSVAISDLAGGEDHTKVIGLTGSLNCNVNLLLNGDIDCKINQVTHPIKSTISSTGSATAAEFLIDGQGIQDSTNEYSYFHRENFRKTSGSYDTQASVTASVANWNSDTHMTGSNVDGHQNGLMCYNKNLYSPKNSGLPNNGNFSTLTNGPAGNPDYSGVSGTRTFYRVISNSSGVEARDIRIDIVKSGTGLDTTTALGSSNTHIFVKIPGTTGWMSATEAFSYGSIADGDGAVERISGNQRWLSFGTASVANGDHIMFKFVADANWTGYIDSFRFLPHQTNATDAPILASLNSNNNGSDAKLSFGTSNTIVGYSPVTASVAGASDLNTNAQYLDDSVDRRGIFTPNKPTIVGVINHAASGDKFRNGFTGSLILKVNGAEVHSVNLETLSAIPSGGGYDTNGNNSGFDLSAVSWQTFASTVNDYRYPYRTGAYQIGPDDQNIGWNYAQVIHRIGSSDTTTSFVDWVVDTDATVMSTSSVNLTNFNHTDVYYQSGVRYFASRPTGSFSYTISNAYRNVYWKDGDGITFPTKTNCTITNTRATGSGITTLDSSGDSHGLPNLNNTANCEQQDLHITGTVLLNDNTSISGAYGASSFTKYDVSVSGKIKHPFKADKTTPTLSKSSFMYYSGSIGSTNLNTEERFNTEHYRIVSGAYANQAAVTSSSNAWNPQTHMNAANAHGDGLVTVNGYAITPLKIGNAGNCQNVADGGSLQCPAGGPDYSTLSEDVRTFYRYFKNNSGVLKQNNLSINLYGDAYLVGKSGALSGSLGANKNIYVEIKVPTDPDYPGGDDKSTGWCDAIKSWDNLEDLTVDGAGLLNGGLTQTVPTGGRAVNLEFQGKGIYDDQYFVVKISVHKNWTGYLSRVRMAYS